MTLLMTVGWPNKTGQRGSGGFGAHDAALALDALEQRGFFCRTQAPAPLRTCR